MYYSLSELHEDMEFEEVMESSLSAAQRRALPDSAFGLPEDRKYPILVKDPDGTDNWSHLKNAIAYFSVCKDEEKRKILAENISRVITEYNVDIEIGPRNPIRRYAYFEMKRNK